MSVSINVQGSLGNPKTVTLGATEGDIYAPAAGGAYEIIINIAVCNTDSSARVVNLYWSDGSTSYEFWRESVAAGDTVEALGLPIRLQPNGGSGVAVKLRGKAAAGSVVNVTVTYTTISGLGSRGG